MKSAKGYLDMLKKGVLPECQFDNCSNKVIGLVPYNGIGKIFICGEHMIERDKKMKEYNERLSRKAMKLLEEEDRKKNDNSNL